VTAPLLQEAAVTEPTASPPALARRGPHLAVTIMARPALMWLGLVWCTTHTVLALVIGLWLGDPRTPGVIALSIAASACFRWYLRYPVGMYNPATRTLIVIGPFGIRYRDNPRDERTLEVRGRRIVESGPRGRTVLHCALIRSEHWAMVARSVRIRSDRGAPLASVRPSFITVRHHRTGWAVAVLAAAGLVYLAASMSASLIAAETDQVTLIEVFEWIAFSLNTTAIGW
jgi:hypothetical protein